MNQSFCAYCDSSGRMTREHLIPRALLTRTPTYTFKLLEASPSRIVRGEQAIRDICPTCNNGVLSYLDSYIGALYTRYFQRIALPGETLRFEYDYQRLIPWLLKVSYNSARTKKERDAARLRRLRHFILGKEPCPLRIATYVQLVVPRSLTKREEATLDPRALRLLPKARGRRQLQPLSIRVARCVAAHMPAGVVCRGVSINSFYFYVVLCEDSRVDRKAWKAARKTIAAQIDGSRQLLATSRAVILKSSRFDFLTAYSATLLANQGPIGRWVKEYVETLNQRFRADGHT